MPVMKARTDAAEPSMMRAECDACGTIGALVAWTPEPDNTAPPEVQTDVAGSMLLNAVRSAGWVCCPLPDSTLRVNWRLTCAECQAHKNQMN